MAFVSVRSRAAVVMATVALGVGGVFVASGGQPTPLEPVVQGDGWPNASNTGVPAGTSLTTVNSDVTLSTPGQTYQDKLVNGCIDVTAANVTIKNVKVNCTGTPGIHSGSTGLVVQDTEVNMGDHVGRTAIGDDHYTAIRVNVYGGENIFWADNNVTVQDSYIHDIVDYNPVDDPHTDGFQMPAGATVITFDHNTVLANMNTPEDPAPGDQGDFGNSAITMGTTGTVTITDNKMSGGGYTLRCQDATTTTNLTITGNRFTTEAGALSGWPTVYSGFGGTDGGGGTDGFCDNFADTYSDNEYMGGRLDGTPVE